MIFIPIHSTARHPLIERQLILRVTDKNTHVYDRLVRSSLSLIKEGSPRIYSFIQFLFYRTVYGQKKSLYGIEMIETEGSQLLGLSEIGNYWLQPFVLIILRPLYSISRQAHLDIRSSLRLLPSFYEMLPYIAYGLQASPSWSL